MLLTSVKAEGYVPLTFRTEITKRSGRITQPLGLGHAPWQLLVSTYSQAGSRSPTVYFRLDSCR